MQYTKTLTIALSFILATSALPSNSGKNNAANALINQAGYNDLSACAQTAIMNDLKNGIPGCQKTDISCYCRNADSFTAIIAGDAGQSCYPGSPPGTIQNGAQAWAQQFCTLARGVFG